MAEKRQLVRFRVALASIAALLAALAIAPAQAAAAEEPELTVMTQNLYLGSSLAPALEASTSQEFVEATARIYATVQYTNFPARAEAIANEIKAREPDLVGLQEATKWTTEGLAAPPGYDFLEILQGDLEARGLHYALAAVAHNAKIGPAALVISEKICPVLEGGKITCGVTLEDRDAILVNEDAPGLSWSSAQSGHYKAQRILTLPAGVASFNRGWAGIDATLDGHSFRFVTTHLETQEDPETQEAQAAEFLAGPAAGPTTIATGDFNSAADGSTTTSYAQLTAPGELVDAWDEEQLGLGYTCCQESNTPPLAPGALNNPTSTLGSRIDLILSRGDAGPGGAAAEVIGSTPFQTEPPFWTSDHAGVIASIRLTTPAVPVAPAGEPPLPLATPDTSVLRARVKAPGKQRQGRRAIVLKLRMKADEAARGTASGKIAIGRRGYRLKTVSQSLQPGRWMLFLMKPAKTGQLKAIRRHLRQGDRVRAKLTGEIVDTAGNRFSRTVGVVLKP